MFCLIVNAYIEAKINFEQCLKQTFKNLSVTKMLKVDQAEHSVLFVMVNVWRLQIN